MWVDVDGGKLHVEQAGDGAPLMLVHGWPLDQRMFEPQMEQISDHLRVITYDRRGFGCSQAAPDLRLELDDIDRILNALALDTVHLLGMSQGGRIALRYAVTKPDRLRSLILQGVFVDGLIISEPESERVPVEEFAELARNGKMDVVRRRWLNHPMMALDSRYISARRLLEEIVSGYTGADLLAFSPENYAFSQNVISAISEFPAPTLILTGAHETMARRAHATKLLETIPDCQEIIFDHSGHLSNLTEPDLYNEHIIRFCRKVDGASPIR